MRLSRKIVKLLGTTKCQAAFNNADQDAKERLARYVDYLDVESVNKWIKDNLPLELYEMSVVSLRNRARLIGIKNYNVLTRNELVIEIQNYERTA